MPKWQSSLTSHFRSYEFHPSPHGICNVLYVVSNHKWIELVQESAQHIRFFEQYFNEFNWSSGENLISVQKYPKC